jgi:peptidoglycan/LPS O-acetylase OafA/YrhL
LSTLNVQPKYRRDIDGLRAIAVLAVIGFHAFPTAVPGGFVGVDVFFVISGFLISTIVFASLNKGSFSFIDFYDRRIRRIFPALILVLAFTWIMGWRLLYPLEYSNLGKHIMGGAGFLSNFLLWRDSGYFDTEAEQKPLLHLWSLAIEEQFYLVWPLTLVLTWRFVRARFALIATIALCSFALCVWATSHDPVVAYYFPVTRFWELLIGAALAYWGVARLRPESLQKLWRHSFRITRWFGHPEFHSVAGFALIAFAIFGIDRHSPFPGWWALVPTIGTFLLIASGPNTFISERLLGTKPLVAIGLISYPLYLWHWPLLCFTRLIQGNGSSSMLLLIAVGLSFPLAYLTYRFLEKPIRRRGPRSFTAAGLTVAMFACAAIGSAANFSAILGKLDTPYSRAIAKAERDWTYPGLNDRTLLVGESEPEVLFVGDSHMQQYYARVKWLVDTKQGEPSKFYTRGGCPPLPRVNRWDTGYQCQDFFDAAMKLSLESPRIRTVVFGAAWENYFLGIPPKETARGPLLYGAGDPHKTTITIESPAADEVFTEFTESIKKLRRAGKRVFVMLNNPTSQAYSPSLRYPSRITMTVPDFDRFTERSTFESFARPVTNKVQTAATRGGATVIDPVDVLCDSTRCRTVGPSGAPLYMDSNHLRATVARDAATFIDRVYR